jgi:hypothetical protein
MSWSFGPTASSKSVRAIWELLHEGVPEGSEGRIGYAQGREIRVETTRPNHVSDRDLDAGAAAYHGGRKLFGFSFHHFCERWCRVGAGDCVRDAQAHLRAILLPGPWTTSSPV